MAVMASAIFMVMIVPVSFLMLILIPFFIVITHGCAVC
jgi:hypothetical protein